MVRTEDNHSVIHLRFDYMSRERQRRDYVTEDDETAVVKILDLTREQFSIKQLSILLWVIFTLVTVLLYHSNDTLKAALPCRGHTHFLICFLYYL